MRKFHRKIIEQISGIPMDFPAHVKKIARLRQLETSQTQHWVGSIAVLRRRKANARMPKPWCFFSLCGKHVSEEIENRSCCLEHNMTQCC